MASQPADRPDELERPSWVTERTWRRFLAVERQGQTLVQVARDEGVSKSAVAQSVIKARAACRAWSARPTGPMRLGLGF